MTKGQFGFAVGFAIATVWALAGFLVVVAAVVLGVLGYGVSRVLAGDPAARDLIDRISARQR